MTTGLVDCVAESSTQALKQGRVSLTGPWRIGLHLLSIVARLPTPGNNWQHLWCGTLTDVLN